MRGSVRRRPGAAHVDRVVLDEVGRDGEHARLVLEGDDPAVEDPLEARHRGEDHVDEAARSHPRRHGQVVPHTLPRLRVLSRAHEQKLAAGLLAGGLSPCNSAYDAHDRALRGEQRDPHAAVGRDRDRWPGDRHRQPQQLGRVRDLQLRRCLLRVGHGTVDGQQRGALVLGGAVRPSRCGGRCGTGRGDGQRGRGGGRSREIAPAPPSSCRSGRQPPSAARAPPRTAPLRASPPVGHTGRGRCATRRSPRVAACRSRGSRAAPSARAVRPRCSRHAPGRARATEETDTVSDGKLGGRGKGEAGGQSSPWRAAAPFCPSPPRGEAPRPGGTRPSP